MQKLELHIFSHNFRVVFSVSQSGSPLKKKKKKEKRGDEGKNNKERASEQQNLHKSVLEGCVCVCSKTETNFSLLVEHE